ncbi:MAG: hypothetical protein U0900_10675 [Myxococcota bacterium]
MDLEGRHRGLSGQGVDPAMGRGQATRVGVEPAGGQGDDAGGERRIELDPRLECAVRALHLDAVLRREAVGRGVLGIQPQGRRVRRARRVHVGRRVRARELAGRHQREARGLARRRESGPEPIEEGWRQQAEATVRKCQAPDPAVDPRRIDAPGAGGEERVRTAARGRGGATDQHFVGRGRGIESAAQHVDAEPLAERREDPPHRSALGDRGHRRRGKGRLRLDHEIGALELAGRRQHVGRELGERRLDDVEDDERVEAGEGALHALGLRERRERIRARDEERADVARLDLVDEGDAGLLTEQARELGAGARTGLDAAFGRGRRTGDARLLEARQHARVERHAALVIEGVGREQQRPAQEFAEQRVGAQRDPGPGHDGDAPGAPDRRDERFEVVGGEARLAGDTLARQGRERAAEGFAVGGVGERVEAVRSDARVGVVVRVRLATRLARGGQRLAHEPGEQDRVGAGARGEVAIGEGGGARAAGIDHDDLAAAAPEGADALDGIGEHREVAVGDGGVPADQDREAALRILGDPDGPGMEEARDHLAGAQGGGDVDGRGGVELARAEAAEQALDRLQAEAVGDGAGALVEGDRVRAARAAQAREGFAEIVEDLVPAGASPAQAGMLEAGRAVVELRERRALGTDVALGAWVVRITADRDDPLARRAGCARVLALDLDEDAAGRRAASAQRSDLHGGPPPDTRVVRA